MTKCAICQREAAADEPLGGWVLRTAAWSACVAEGFEVPGWLFLELRRHAEGPASMDPAEAAELGGLVARLADAITAATGAERVYMQAYGEMFPHFHVLLSPRLPDTPLEERGPAQMSRREALVDRAAAATTAAAVRSALAKADTA